MRIYMSGILHIDYEWQNTNTHTNTQGQMTLVSVTSSGNTISWMQLEIYRCTNIAFYCQMISVAPEENTVQFIMNFHSQS